MFIKVQTLKKTQGVGKWFIGKSIIFRVFCCMNFNFIFGGPIEKSEILQDPNFYHINKSISYRLWFG